jgi:transposase
MNYYIGIDVSKQTLKVFDGRKDYEVPNERGTKTLEKLIKRNYGKEWRKVRLIYEPTGPYSKYLREFASTNKLKVYEVNPKKVLTSQRHWVIGPKQMLSMLRCSMDSIFY